MIKLPLPKPHKNESKDTFLERCMGNDTMVEEYPEEKQRYAICLGQWKDKEDKSISSDIEKRTFDFQMGIEKREDESQSIVGHAAVFNEYADIGWFQERIMPDAFKGSIRKDDIRALFNHDPNYVLGRNKAGTLALKEDGKGLAIKITPPDTSFARDLMKLIERGDITQMSFAFQVLEEAWEYGDGKEPDKRDLVKVKLYDVSPVTYPAYPQTDVAIKSFRTWQESHKKPVLNWKPNLMRKCLDLKLRGGKTHE